MLASWGVTPQPRIGVEFRVVSIPANEETGQVYASGWVDWDGVAVMDENFIRSAVETLATKAGEAEIFVGEDLI